jgi:N-acetylglucosamine kinase-like BadF-type ATPase
MYYLGVDGGGSKTLCAICDERGQLIASAMSGCGNHQTNQALARKNIHKAVEEALLSARLTRGDIENAVFGLAGADREVDFSVLRPMVKALRFRSWKVVCDTVVALRAGARSQHGVVLICGTGTNCYGMNVQGEDFQCGGMGYAYGDFGGSELAVEAFRSVIRAWDGRGKQTHLTDAILKELGYPTVDAMWADFLDNGLDIPMRLVPLLFETAHFDAVARGILRRQGEELGLAAAAVIRRLRMQTEPFDLVMAGSILSRGDSRFLLPYIQKAVERVTENCNFRVLSVQPVAGALFMAMQAGGGEVSDSVRETLCAALQIRGE